MHKEYYFINQKYSEEEIRKLIQKHPEEFNRYFWIDISLNQKLSEDFIREFQDKVYWYWISGHQKLSENFIIEFQDKVSWICISRNQDISESFLIEFIDKIDIDFLKRNKHISEDVKNRIIALKKVQNG